MNIYLPPEIIEHIISYLPLYHTIHAAEISKTWNLTVTQYFQFHKIENNIEGLILDYYSRKQYHFLERLWEKGFVHILKIALIMTGKYGLFEPVKFFFHKPNKETSIEIENFWGIPAIMNKIYLEAVYNNQINFLDDFDRIWKHFNPKPIEHFPHKTVLWSRTSDGRWDDFIYPTPIKPYSYETVLWIKNHNGKQYEKLFEYYDSQNDIHVEDIYHLGFVKKEDYYFHLGKKGYVPGIINEWVIYGAIEGNHDGIDEMISKFGRENFEDRIMSLLAEDFNEKLINVYKYIASNVLCTLDLFNKIKWKTPRLQYFCMLYSRFNFDSEWRGTNYIISYIRNYADVDQLKIIVNKCIIAESYFTSDNMIMIALKSQDCFKIAYDKIVTMSKYPTMRKGLCTRLLSNGLYNLYEYTHQHRIPICEDMCRTFNILRLITFKKFHLIPLFMHKQAVNADQEYTLSKPDNIWSWMKHDIEDVKELLLMGYVPKDDLFELYKNNCEMICWLRANKFISDCK